MSKIEIIDFDDAGHTWKALLPNGEIVENWDCNDIFPEYYEDCSRLAMEEYANELQIQRDRDEDVRKYRQNLGYK